MIAYLAARRRTYCQVRRLLLATLLAMALPAAAGPRFTIDGQPIFGSFAVTWKPDELRQALDTGINLFYCYDRKAGVQLLDPNTEMGAMILRGRAKAMYNLCSAVGPRLMADIDAAATEIHVSGTADSAEPGVIWAGDEAIRFQSCNKRRLLGCERGYRDTRPAPHPKDEYLVYEDRLRAEVLKRKDSPNLWGYWIMDDKRGNQRAALRNAYRIIKDTDVDQTGKRNNHVVVAGMANEDALTNFDARVCDMVGIYIYPARRGVYEHTLIADRLKRMLPIIEQRSPGTPFMGIIQAFTGEHWIPKPTRLQVRKQLLDFAHFGASTFMVYSWRMVRDYKTLRNLPDLRAEVGQMIGDLNAGTIALDRQTPTYPEPPSARPDLSALTPLVALDKPDLKFTPRPGVSASLAAGMEGAQWLHLQFAQYAEGKPQWPSVLFGSEQMSLKQDFSGAGWVVAKVHNFLPQDSEMGLSVRDSRGKPWWARYFPLPANRTTDVCAPLSEMRTIIDPSDVSTITVLMRRPAVETHLALVGLYVAPRQFARAKAAVYRCPRTATAPTVDGDSGDACWQRAEPITLQDESLSTAPIRDTTLRVVSARGRLYFLVESNTAGGPLHTSDKSEAKWQMYDDTVELLLHAPTPKASLMFVASANGRSSSNVFAADGTKRPCTKPEFACAVNEGKWRLEVGVDPAVFGKDAGVWGLNVRRRDRQIGPLVWPKDPTLPIGVEALGTLQLPRD